MLFEGECLRGLEQVEGYLRLDTGTCRVEGSSEPVPIMEEPQGNPVFVPKKCLGCDFLHHDRIREYVCKQDHKRWQDGFRDLDWGDWEPDYPMLGLRRGMNGETSGPAIITREIIKGLQEDRRVEALKVYRKLNQIETLAEAIADIDRLEKKIKEIEE